LPTKLFRISLNDSYGQTSVWHLQDANKCWLRVSVIPLKTLEPTSPQKKTPEGRKEYNWSLVSVSFHWRTRASCGEWWKIIFHLSYLSLQRCWLCQLITDEHQNRRRGIGQTWGEARIVTDQLKKEKSILQLGICKTRHRPSWTSDWHLKWQNFAVFQRVLRNLQAYYW
jgi:hypothetical protein